MDPDPVAERLEAARVAVDVERLHALARLGRDQQRVGAGVGILERKNGQHAVADEFQDFTAVALHRLRHGIEIFVQQQDHIVARPQLRDGREPTQIADQDHGAHRDATPSGDRTIEDLRAGMGSDIGVE